MTHTLHHSRSDNPQEFDDLANNVRLSMQCAGDKQASIVAAGFAHTFGFSTEALLAAAKSTDKLSNT